MKKFSLLVLVGSVVLVSTASCKKCYNCSKRIVIEVDGQLVETDEFYMEEACGQDEKGALEDDGFGCSQKN